MSDPALPAPLVRRLDEHAARLADLRRLLGEESVLADGRRVVELSREVGRIEPVVAAYEAWRRARREIEDLAGMASGQDEMGQLAREELPALEDRAAGLRAAIEEQFLAADDHRVESFFLEIRAGTGGEEAALFARDLFTMYQRLCERRRWGFLPSDIATSERGGFKEAIVQVRGAGAYRRLQYEAGGHRVQRVPETEAQGRIHTSAATVAVIPEMPDVQIEVRPEDVEQFGCRGGGPGGQNVNKVETGWFIRHKPSGLTFKITEHKSQQQNRERAWALLRATLDQAERDRQHAAVATQRRAMMGSGDRSQRIRTYNFPQNRCTDHRLGGEEASAKNFNLQTILAGELDELIDALIEADRRQRLEAL